MCKLHDLIKVYIIKYLSKFCAIFIIPKRVVIKGENAIKCVIKAGHALKGQYQSFAAWHRQQAIHQIFKTSAFNTKYMINNHT